MQLRAVQSHRRKSKRNPFGGGYRYPVIDDNISTAAAISGFLRRFGIARSIVNNVPREKSQLYNYITQIVSDFNDAREK